MPKYPKIHHTPRLEVMLAAVHARGRRRAGAVPVLVRTPLLLVAPGAAPEGALPRVERHLDLGPGRYCSPRLKLSVWSGIEYMVSNPV